MLHRKGYPLVVLESLETLASRSDSVSVHMRLQ